MREEEHALEVDPVEAVEVRFGDLVDGRVVGGARVADQRVETFGSHLPQGSGHGLDKGVERADLTRVQGQGDS